MANDRDYIFGTHDEELQRLGLQHAVWRPRASDAWRRAGFTAGQTIIDVGCGPGFASMDLAEIVGAHGHVHAVDRSRKFLDAVESARRGRGLHNITTHEIDLNDGALPAMQADGAWVRWVFAFVTKPRDLLARIHGALRPGGVLVFHEYFDYSTWCFIPRSEEHEEFVRCVMQSWRADGGEPNIGLNLAAWLGELGFAVASVKSIVEIISPGDFLWQWPKSFIRIGLERFVDTGRLSRERADAIAQAFDTGAANPHTLMITPAVMEVIAVRQ